MTVFEAEETRAKWYRESLERRARRQAELCEMLRGSERARQELDQRWVAILAACAQAVGGVCNDEDDHEDNEECGINAG